MDVYLDNVWFRIDFPSQPITFQFDSNGSSDDCESANVTATTGQIYNNFKIYLPCNINAIIGDEKLQIRVQNNTNMIQSALNESATETTLQEYGDVNWHYIHCWRTENDEMLYKRGFFLVTKCDFKSELDKSLSSKGFTLFAQGKSRQCDNIDPERVGSFFKRCKVSGYIGQPDDKGPVVEVEVFPKPQATSLAPHPVFIDWKNTTLIPNLNEAFSLLEQCPTSVTGIQELKSVVHKELKDQHVALNFTAKHPLIVVEGLDASGKTTAVEELKHTLRARQFQTPPPCLKNLRPIMDAHPPLIRRLYYTFGNYIVSKQIKETLPNKVVVMDRFWYSTTVYAMADDSAVGDEKSLPPPTSDVYQWPRDLVKPSFVFLLIVSEETRHQRLYGRIASSGEGQTKEEKELEVNHLKRRRILEAYRRMKDPAPIEIDANVDKESVLQQLTNALQETELM